VIRRGGLLHNPAYRWSQRALYWAPASTNRSRPNSPGLSGV